MRALAGTLPELLRPTDRLPFNRPCSGVRGHCWTSSAFAEARAIKTALGGTINDVVMTVVAGAVSRYVRAHREPVKGRLVRFMVPVNLRTEDPQAAAGNEISMLPLSLPLDVDDPVERLRVVAMRSAAMKAARIADVVHLIGTWLGWTPPAVQENLAALPFLPQPVLIVNMVCTNVPGPMFPLYANGRQLLTYYPHVPCGSDVGISVAISSYNQKLYYGVTYDLQAAPDGELFRDFLVEAYEELRDAAGIRPVAAAASASEAHSPAVTPESMQTAPEPAAAEPEPLVEAQPTAEATPPAAIVGELQPEKELARPVAQGYEPAPANLGPEPVATPAPRKRKAKRSSRPKTAKRVAGTS
jgi:hypothetical protein